MIRLHINLGLWRIRRALGIAVGPDIARVRLTRRGLRASSSIGPVAVRSRRRPRRAGRASIAGIVFAAAVAIAFVACVLAGVR
jgi:hypothetical protein